MKQFDVIIIGGGVTGFATAMYAGRLALKTLVVSEQRGGVITWTDNVENYPGFKKLTGLELAEKIEEHAMEYGIEVEDDLAVKVEKQNNLFKVTTKAGKSFQAKTIIFATGTKVRKLGVPGENKLNSKGVHFCALCDGMIYKDKIMAVVGGSDSAAKEALVLAQYAKKVYMIYRGDKIHPEPPNMKRVEEKIKEGKLEIIYKTKVIEVLGKDKVEAVKLDKKFNEKDVLELSAVFIAIGHIPQSDLAKGLGVKVDDKNEIIINRNSETNVEGVFAAGDVCDTRFKQAIVGVGEGVSAAYSAFLYIEHNKDKFK